MSLRGFAMAITPLRRVSQGLTTESALCPVVFRHQPTFQHQVIDPATGMEGLKRHFGGCFIADIGV
jgi:hypothetical protein